MIAGVMGVVVLAILVAACLAWKDWSRNKRAIAERIERLEGAHIFKMKILGHLLKRRNRTDYRMRIVEELSMEIEMFKLCVKQLTEEKLIASGSPHTLTLTDFGKKFAQVYVEQKLEDVAARIAARALPEEEKK
jgi:hypothetical protein